MLAALSEIDSHVGVRSSSAHRDHGLSFTTPAISAGRDHCAADCFSRRASVRHEGPGNGRCQINIGALIVIAGHDVSSVHPSRSAKCVALRVFTKHPCGSHHVGPPRSQSLALATGTLAAQRSGRSTIARAMDAATSHAWRDSELPHEGDSPLEHEVARADGDTVSTGTTCAGSTALPDG